MKKVVVCLIVTRKYHIFVQPLIDSIKKYFLLRHQIEIVLFTDDIEIDYKGDERVKITKDLIVSWGFPLITLKRYEIMTSRTYDCSYIYYIDVDALVVAEVDESIFGDIVAVRHPGFEKMGGGSWETNKQSNAYTYEENRIAYWAGGFGGGSYERYYPLMKRMKRDIQDDEKNGVMPIWHDESIWNFYLSELKSFTKLNSAYCMPEPFHLRKAWRIDGIEPKILMLDKDHKSIRE